MSQIFSPILIVILGGLVAVVVSILALDQLSGVGGLGSQSANLVSSSTSISGLLPVIAMILSIGVLGTIMSRKH